LRYGAFGSLPEGPYPASQNKEDIEDATDHSFHYIIPSTSDAFCLIPCKLITRLTSGVTGFLRFVKIPDIELSREKARH